MKKYSYIFLILISFRLSSNAQNLVPNQSFENANLCPADFDELWRVQNWVDYGIGINYFNACSPSCDDVGICDSYGHMGIRNPCGYQLPYDGDSYVGVHLAGIFISPIPPYDTSWGTGGFYLGAQLIQNLIPGTKYFVTAHISRAGGYYGYNGACNNFGFHFYTYPHDSINRCSVDNNAQVHETNIVTDSVNWTRVSGSFIADSAYQYLALGNFYDRAHTDTIEMINNNQIPSNFAYYYVDYVSVSEDSLWDVTATLEITKSGQQIEIYPNPASTVLNIKNSGSEKTLFTISDVLGKVIYKKLSESNFLQIDIIDIKPGLYFIHNSEGVNKKFVKL